jgi:hypothetical protein
MVAASDETMRRMCFGRSRDGNGEEKLEDVGSVEAVEVALFLEDMKLRFLLRQLTV